MNIFQEYDGIIGTVDVNGLRQSLKEFFKLASTIRQKLGARAYLLDQYISYLLEQANHTLCYQIADEGFSATGELGRLYHEVEKGNRASQEHLLYEKTVSMYQTHPLPYQEHNTQFEILKVAMFSDGLQYMVEEYAKEQRDRLRGAADIVHVKHLYDEISHIIGDEALLEQLNEAAALSLGIHAGSLRAKRDQ